MREPIDHTQSDYIVTAAKLAGRDLLRLVQQLEADQDVGWQELHTRDYEIGRTTGASQPTQQLLAWLDRLQLPDPRRTLDEAAVSVLFTALFFVMGIVAMSGLLLASASGVVNAPWFFALFPGLQLLLCLMALLALVTILRGKRAAALNLNPARWVLQRYLPATVRLEQFNTLLQLALLRYGQLMGLGFVAGNLVAYLLILTLNDITFVWSSTFQVSNEAMLSATQAVAAPWSGWLPWATLGPDVISHSRYQPGIGSLPASQLQAARDWWPFMLLAQLCYGLLPRLLLWGGSSVLFARRLNSTFLNYPGVDLVLRRLNQAPVSTQGEEGSDYQLDERNPALEVDDSTLVISWSGALEAQQLTSFAELQAVDPSSWLSAGYTLAQDQQAIQRCAGEQVKSVLLVAKSWEPPMSDLADFLVALNDGVNVSLLLRPLENQPVSSLHLQDWRDFNARLAQPLELRALSPVQLAAGSQ
jgi:Protein of unknown function (DUF2868)